jgi:uncharacterized protein
VTENSPSLAASPQNLRETQIAGPVTQKERITSVDCLRGVAILGILILNIVAFGLPYFACFDTTVAGGSTGANLSSWFINQLFFEGKMRTLFSMLFGAGVVLFTHRLEKRAPGVRVADIFLRRNLWLIVFGLIHAYFIWEWDILYAYGVVGLMLFTFRHAPPKRLIVAGLLLLTVLPYKHYVHARELQSMRDTAAQAALAENPTEDQREAQKAWADYLKEHKPGPEEIAKETAGHLDGYWAYFHLREGGVAKSQSVGFYGGEFFDTASMMLIGMGLYLLGVLSADRSYPFYATMIALGYGIGVPINAFVAYRTMTSGFDPVVMAFGGCAYDVGRLTVACGHIGVVMLLMKSGSLRWLTSRLAATGQMALTNYISQSLICTTLFSGYGLGLFGKLQRYQLWYVVFSIWVFQLIASPIWLRYYRYGPLEWVWRSLTYWHKQPFRRVALLS